TTHECYLCILENLYRQVIISKQQVVHPTSVLLRLKKIGTEFSRHRQSDANEFMIKLLEKVESSLLVSYKNLNLDYPSKCTTLLHQIMGSWMQSKVKCPKCQHVSTTFTNEFFCSLEIPPGVDNLEKALHKYTRPEILASGNEWKCEKCKEYVNASKRITFHEPPLILCLQLKRFEFSSHYISKKITKSISFKEYLDLQPYVSTPLSQTKFEYSLQSVIVHYGNVQGGHYFAYIKAPNNLWYEMNDTRVRLISLKKVLSATSDSYVLFYTNDEVCTPSTSFSSVTQSSMPSPPHSSGSSPLLDCLPSYPSGSSQVKNYNSKLLVASKHETSSINSFANPNTPSKFAKLPHRNLSSSVSLWHNPMSSSTGISFVQDYYNKSYLDKHFLSNQTSKRPSNWDLQYDQGKVKKTKKKF
ncbi:hypothetical protein HMI56_003259, partial [Coelomomyces lativittatus]